ncbi:MAG: GrpB family protein [Nocardioides sp.]
MIREPWWHEHRVLTHHSPRAHLHVFSPGSAEVVRHRMFRDWLAEHPADRASYAEAKRSAAAASNGAGGTMQDYNALKQPVLREIYDRMFRAHGLI